MKLSEVLHYYLPYNLRYLNRLDLECILTIDRFNDLSGVKPILIPLLSLNSDFLKECDIGFMYRCEIMELKHKQRNIASMHFSTVQLCLENHYDIFGLIPEGLAVEKESKK